MNSVTNARFEASDGFDALDALVSRRERFDMVILDPPKFTRTRRSLEDALRAYHRINRLGASLLPPGGILVTCSCSGNVTREDFLHMLAGVAQQLGARFRSSSSARRAGSPDKRHLPRKRIPEVLHLPGAVRAEQFSFFRGTAPSDNAAAPSGLVKTPLRSAEKGGWRGETSPNC